MCGSIPHTGANFKTHTMKNTSHTTDARQFYSMIALMRVASYFGKDLIKSKSVGPAIKQDLHYTVLKMEGFETKAFSTAPQEAKKIWLKEWQDRDYIVFASVLSLMSEMNEEQRSVVEQTCEAISKGEHFVVEVEPQ